MKSILIVFAVGSNHMANIRTLQNIYEQDYPHIYLAVSNNSVVGFQSERFFYNLNENKGKNIEQVYFYERKRPTDKATIAKELIGKFNCDYIVFINSGDLFEHISSLGHAVQELERRDAEALVSPVIRVNSHSDLTELLPEKAEDLRCADIPECSAIYRTAAFLAALNSVDTILFETGRILSKIGNIAFSDTAICKTPTRTIPVTAVRNNMSFEMTNSEKAIQFLLNTQNKALYILSRKKMVILYFVLFLISAALFCLFSLFSDGEKLLWAVLLTVTVMFFLLTAAAVLINIIYKFVSKSVNR